MGEIHIHGHLVRYEDDALDGIHYLENKLDENESKVFFDEAKRRKVAEFEDYHRWNYELTYNGDASYTLTKRSR